MIGLYGSIRVKVISFSFGFFSRRRTMARFRDFGSMPDDSDALHIWHNTGARTTAVFFTNHVGTGSRSQCFGGTFLSNAMFSCVVTAWNADKLDVAWSSTSATVARCGGTNPIHLGCEVVGEFIRRRRLGDDGWWWLQQCIHLRPLRSIVMSVLCDCLGPVRLETGFEHYSLMCKLLAPGREQLICLHLSVDSFEVTPLDLF